ncbi:hypothetical protein H2248_012043 [Termitomyces sp. 'cryptogamus']|nr:hypothetical protein H2248_012043 [Termitomyces sp. 'cryptogamus']
MFARVNTVCLSLVFALCASAASVSVRNDGPSSDCDTGTQQCCNSLVELLSFFSTNHPILSSARWLGSSVLSLDLLLLTLAVAFPSLKAYNAPPKLLAALETPLVASLLLVAPP